MTTDTGYLIVGVSVLTVLSAICSVIAYELIKYPEKYKSWNDRRLRYRRFKKDERSRVQMLKACGMGRVKILETIMPAAETAVDDEIRKMLTVTQLSKNPFWQHYIHLQEQIRFIKLNPAKIYRRPATVRLPFLKKPESVGIESQFEEK